MRLSNIGLFFKFQPIYNEFNELNKFRTLSFAVFFIIIHKIVYDIEEKSGIVFVFIFLQISVTLTQNAFRNHFKLLYGITE